MKKNRTLIISLLLIAALAIGIGYADLVAVNLNIAGNVQVTPNQNNFGVKFESANSTGPIKATVNVLGDTLKASMDVTMLTKEGDSAEATFVIKCNDESQYAAIIEKDPIIAEFDEDYFEIKTDHDKDVTLQPGKTHTVKVTVRLKKTPAVAKTTPINITFTATPVEVTEDTTETP